MYTIYGSTTCSFCKDAKELLESKGIDYTYTDISKNSSALSMFREKGFRTVPQIFTESGEHIGGFKDLLDHLSDS